MDCCRFLIIILSYIQLIQNFHHFKFPLDSFRILLHFACFGKQFNEELLLGYYFQASCFLFNLILLYCQTQMLMMLFSFHCSNSIIIAYSLRTFLIYFLSKVYEDWLANFSYLKYFIYLKIKIIKIFISDDLTDFSQ